MSENQFNLTNAMQALNAQAKTNHDFGIDISRKAFEARQSELNQSAQQLAGQQSYDFGATMYNTNTPVTAEAERDFFGTYEETGIPYDFNTQTRQRPRAAEVDLLRTEINRLRIALSQAKANLDRNSDLSHQRLSASWEHLPCPTSSIATPSKSPFPFGTLRRGNSQAIGLSSHLPY
jgi:hypothetical protein